MNQAKDIADLLEEVHSMVHTLRDEKSDLKDQVERLEAELASVNKEKSLEGGNLQALNMQLQTELRNTRERLTRELQDTKDRFSSELQETQNKLDRFHPELLTLQHECQNTELQNNLLQIELANKEEEITILEDRLHTYTSLASTPSAIEEHMI